MKRTVNLCISLILLFVSTDIYPQNIKFEIENWEKRINVRQPPEVVLDAVGIKEGMIVGEIGAGTGRMTLWIADRIGPSGKIYANDIDFSGLDQIKKRAKIAGFKNIEIIHGEVTDPKLPSGSLDIIFMINVFHHLDDPVTILRNTIPSLKAGGHLAIVDCDPAKISWGKSHGCTGREEMKIILKQAGYKLTKILDNLVEDSIYIAAPEE